MGNQRRADLVKLLFKESILTQRMGNVKTLVGVDAIQMETTLKPRKSASKNVEVFINSKLYMTKDQVFFVFIRCTFSS